MSEIAKQLEALRGQIVSVVRGYVERSTAEVKAKVEALETRVAEMPSAERGEKGEPGEKGPAGEVDPAVLRALVADAVREAVSALPPARDGKDCDMTVVQVLVEAAVKAAVITPKDGEDGRDGRDAIELEILPEIAPTKQYPRGTWARHAGGLVRAVCDTRVVTDGDMERAGWEVMVEGVKSMQIEQTGERTFRAVSELTSGVKSSIECALPVLLDRGRYSDEKSYEPGDVVDWSGSMWIAQKAAQGVEPRVDVAEWRLSVRRGRDGKDAIVRTVEPQRVKV